MINYAIVCLMIFLFTNTIIYPSQFRAGLVAHYVQGGMVQTLIEQGMKLDYQDYRPSILFINGEYWGIHNIREKFNEHYVFCHHGVNKDNLDIIEIRKRSFSNNGDLVAYNEMINFLSTNNMG
ncbi:MAG: CotH kinase family protein [Ignavibacteriales bacterium]|nr:CotH kinase family protein [Ignavibacteriales bacterium]